jgi:hypothetical protein
MGKNPKWMQGDGINQGVGLGQMTIRGCQDVDTYFFDKGAAGSCWAAQTDPNNLAGMIANTEALLAIKIMYGNGDLREGLKKYGPRDANYGEYADPLLACEDCMKANADAEGHVPDANALSCFNKMNADISAARAQRKK